MQGAATQDKGENARLQSFVGAIAIGDLVKSTLGPKGMDKILQSMDPEGPRSGQISVTNDGATILGSIWVDNPAAKLLIDISRTQDIQCGDGTTGVVVIASELLRKAEQLVETNKLHPQTIINGFRRATEVALARLEKLAVSPSQNDLYNYLLSLAKTTLSSKLVRFEREKFAKLAVDAVLRLHGKPMDYIQVLKKQGGRMEDSYLEEGFILDKRPPLGMPRLVKNCKILVANTPMDTDKIKIYGAKVKVESLSAIAEIEEAEKAKMAAKIDKIVAHGCNVFINRQLIYNYPTELLHSKGVWAIEHADFDGTERLTAVLGADVVSTFDDPARTKLGSCDSISTVQIGDDTVIRFTGCAKKEACCIVLRGSSAHVLDEAERSLHDAIAIVYQCVNSDARLVAGGGSSEMEMAQAVSQEASSVSTKEALAIEAFSSALSVVPATLSDNSGLDSASVVAMLKSLHAEGGKVTSKGDSSSPKAANSSSTASGKSGSSSSGSVSNNYRVGIDVFSGEVTDMAALGVYESYKSKRSQISIASEAAQAILRVDSIIRQPPRQRQ